MAGQIVQLNKPELLDRYERLKNMVKSAKAKAEKPMVQGGMGLSAVVGGAIGGGVAGLRPHVFRVPTDAVLGAVVAIPALWFAGSTGGNMAALLGWGMITGSTARGTHDVARNWREQRAADGGDAQASQIVALQKQLDDLRKTREAPKPKT